MNKEVEKLIREVSANRAKIIDDFVKTYVATRWDDYFSKQKKLDFRRLMLVERIVSPTERTYHIELKKGRLPNQ